MTELEDLRDAVQAALATAIRAAAQAAEKAAGNDDAGRAGTFAEAARAMAEAIERLKL
jgi:hypothetical protein